ncbi:MAG: DNA polymerase III subunit gamma/tau [bacterium]|nr:DNA polymerase III subunit gamma/tau [bacterium]
MGQAFYRKYRPKNLSDLLGHETNVEVLQNAAKGDRLGQAYLFYGPRGTGKTTSARLIAKLLNCEKRHEDAKFRAQGEPCNECRSCREIDAQNSLDVIEIDAASNRGIDEIRDLKEGIKTAPAASKYKVYIIDEAHMLTGPAFNALLKTLEEPPAHAAFILATTEYEKLPATITSRTQRFLFKKIAKEKIMEKLSSIAKAEKISAEPDALELIAASGDGSLRDAESLLDQISAGGGKVTLELAERLIGRVGFKKIEELASRIMKRDLKNSIGFLQEINDEGYNLVSFTKDLIHYLRKVLSLSLDPSLEKIFHGELTAEEINRMKKLLPLVKTDAHVALLRSLIRAYGEMRYSPFASIPLEIALVENLS